MMTVAAVGISISFMTMVPVSCQSVRVAAMAPETPPAWFCDALAVVGLCGDYWYQAYRPPGELLIRRLPYRGARHLTGEIVSLLVWN